TSAPVWHSSSPPSAPRGRASYTTSVRSSAGTSVSTNGSVPWEPTSRGAIRASAETDHQERRRDDMDERRGGLGEGLRTGIGILTALKEAIEETIEDAV